MNNGTQTCTEDLAVKRPEVGDHPPKDSIAKPQDDTSDDAQQQPQQRTHPRGGRKNRSKAELDESGKPWSQRTGRLNGISETFLPSETGEDEEGAGTQTKEQTKERPSEPNGSNGAPKVFETGVRAFNLKRADESTGGRPFGISVEREKDSGKKSKSKKKEKKAKKKSKKKQESSDEESSSESEEEDDKRKPLSIRLDLNLELEIFLRAKVKGDITITFLE